MDKVQIKADRMIEVLNLLCKTEHDATKGQGKYLIISDNGDIEIVDRPKKRLLTDLSQITMTKMNCSISAYVEMATTGCVKTVEEYVESLFLDDETIVHCEDNGEDYHKCDAGLLVAFIKARTNE